MRTLFIGAVFLLPLPTLFEIPLAYSLLLSGAPLGMIAAVLFIGPAVNLPSLLVVSRAAGIKAGLLLAVLTGRACNSDSTRVSPLSIVACADDSGHA
jgi:uncharacterized membrane protein YraQ (UPF0718 family)